MLSINTLVIERKMCIRTHIRTSDGRTDTRTTNSKTEYFATNVWRCITLIKGQTEKLYIMQCLHQLAITMFSKIWLFQMVHGKQVTIQWSDYFLLQCIALQLAGNLLSCKLLDVASQKLNNYSLGALRENEDFIKKKKNTEEFLKMKTYVATQQKNRVVRMFNYFIYLVLSSEFKSYLK